MTDWLRRLLGLHVHKWRHLSTETIGGYDYWSGNIHFVCGIRTVYFRECSECGRWQQYYPDAPWMNFGYKYTYPAPEGWEP